MRCSEINVMFIPQSRSTLQWRARNLSKAEILCQMESSVMTHFTIRKAVSMPMRPSQGLIARKTVRRRRGYPVGDLRLSGLAPVDVLHIREYPRILLHIDSLTVNIFFWEDQSFRRSSHHGSPRSLQTR